MAKYKGHGYAVEYNTAINMKMWKPHTPQDDSHIVIQNET